MTDSCKKHPFSFNIPLSDYQLLRDGQLFLSAYQLVFIQTSWAQVALQQPQHCPQDNEAPGKHVALRLQKYSSGLKDNKQYPRN